MGSWNETCALTRLPIVPGDPVVKFHTVSVPTACFKSIHELGSVPLMLGLFSRGKYDDYGDVVLATDALTVNNELWCSDALVSNDFWRAIPIEGAEDAPHLIPLEGQQLFYGMSRAFDLLGGPDENYGAYSQWLSAACNAYAADNKLWADNLPLNEPQSLATVQSVLHRHGMQAFTDRWMIAKSWMHAQEMLTTQPGQLLVHGDAFDTMVRASRSVAKEKRWMADWTSWQKMDTEMKGLGLGQGWTRPGAMDWQPLSNPYRTSNTPIYAHFWHTLEPMDALQRISMEDLMQYNAFVKGIVSTRVNLEAGHPGGQDRNRSLLTRVVKSVRSIAVP